MALAIFFMCDCGKLLKAKKDCAGRRTKCPHCGAIKTIPAESTVGAAAMAAVGGPSADGASHVAGMSADDLGAIRIDDGPAPTPSTAPTVTLEVPAPAPEAADDPPDHEAERQYRVLTHKDMGFTTRFDAHKLEETLNRFARRGWSVKGSVVINIPGHSGPHDELVVILER